MQLFSCKNARYCPWICSVKLEIVYSLILYSSCSPTIRLSPFIYIHVGYKNGERIIPILLQHLT